MAQTHYAIAENGAIVGEANTTERTAKGWLSDDDVAAIATEETLIETQKEYLF